MAPRSLDRHPLARWWGLLLAAALVAGVASYVALSRQEPTYRSEARVLVGQLRASYDSIRAAESLAGTMAELATSDLLLEDAAAQAGITTPLDELAEQVAAVPVGTSRVVLITVTMDDPAASRDMANALAISLRNFGTTSGGQVVAQTTLVDAAERGEVVPTRMPLLVALATLGGVAVAVALALLLEPLLDPRLQASRSRA